MPMNLLQACRAGKCRRSGPREQAGSAGHTLAVGDQGYHLACLFNQGLLSADEVGPEVMQIEREADALCEGNCERWTEPCWAMWRGALVSTSPEIWKRPVQDVCQDIYLRWITTAQVINAVGKHRAQVAAVKLRRSSYGGRLNDPR